MGKDRKLGREIRNQRKQNQNQLINEKEINKIKERKNRYYSLFQTPMIILIQHVAEIFEGLIAEKYLKSAEETSRNGGKVLSYRLGLNCGAKIRCTFSFLTWRTEEYELFSEGNEFMNVSLVINSHLVNYHTLREKLKQCMADRSRREEEFDQLKFFRAYIASHPHSSLISVEHGTSEEDMNLGIDFVFHSRAAQGKTVRGPLIDTKMEELAYQKGLKKWRESPHNEKRGFPIYFPKEFLSNRQLGNQAMHKIEQRGKDMFEREYQ